MDDEKVYGKVLYRYSFSDAIKVGHLADYRILVLGLDCDQERGGLEEVLQRKTDGGSQIQLPEAVKMLGCWQALRNPRASDGLRRRRVPKGKTGARQVGRMPS